MTPTGSLREPEGEGCQISQKRLIDKATLKM
jgi:hypothetical protein